MNDVNEIWLSDLAYVDNLANYNRGAKSLFVAVDCLSQYLREEPMKTNYVTKRADALKNDQL